MMSEHQVASQEICPGCGQVMIMLYRKGGRGTWTEHLCQDKKDALVKAANAQSEWERENGKWVGKPWEMEVKK